MDRPARRGCRRRPRGERRRRSRRGLVAAHGVDGDREHRASAQATSTATRFLYQPQDGHTVCGVLAWPQRGQTLRAGAASFQAPARRAARLRLRLLLLGNGHRGSPDKKFGAVRLRPRRRQSSGVVGAELVEDGPAVVDQRGVAVARLDAHVLRRRPGTARGSRAGTAGPRRPRAGPPRGPSGADRSGPARWGTLRVLDRARRHSARRRRSRRVSASGRRQRRQCPDHGTPIGPDSPMSSIVDSRSTSTAMSPTIAGDAASTSAGGTTIGDVLARARVTQQLRRVDEQRGAPTHLSGPGRRSPWWGRRPRSVDRLGRGAPIDSRWRPAPTVFWSLSSRISKLPSRWSRKSSVS